MTPTGSNQGGNRRPHSSFGRRRPRGAAWTHGENKTARKGTDIRYGQMDLSPKDHYHVTDAKNAPGKLRVVVMGGNEEVGKNMTMIEYEDDIILIDMGIQFGEEHMRGIDGIVPDLSYLKGKEKNVRAVIITHMHMDHIGGIPFLMPLLPGVPVFSTPITLALVAKKLEYTPDVKVELNPVDEATKLTLGHFTVSFIGVAHSVPSALGIVIDTPCGKLVHTGDFKVDLEPMDDEGRHHLDQMKSLGNQNVLALLSDSTNATQQGNQLMERNVTHELDSLVANANGRLLFGMISTNVVRLGQIIALAEKYGRHVVVGGLSLRTTLEIAENLGYISPLPGTIIDIADTKGLPPQKILAIFPGAQGEPNAAFFKLADGTLRDMQVRPGDTVVFSSSVIPGNERTVQFITDKFYRLGAKVVNYRMLNIHAGGHAKAADLAEVVKMINPKYLVPIEGHHAFLHHHAQAAVEGGFPRDKVMIADNGQIMEFDQDGSGKLLREKLTLNPIFVDANILDTVDGATLMERKRLGDEGVVVVHATVEGGRIGQIRMESYGFRTANATIELEKKVGDFIRQEYTKVGSRREAPRAIREGLQKMLEKETASAPFVSFFLHRPSFGGGQSAPRPQPGSAPRQAYKPAFSPKPAFAPTKPSYNKPATPNITAPSQSSTPSQSSGPSVDTLRFD